MFCHNHEAITTPSPLPGQAALRRESGCSPRKALPAPSSAATPIWQDTGQLHCFFVIFGQYTGRAPGCCAGLLRRRAAASCCGVVLRRRAGGPRGVHKLSRHATNSLLHISLVSFCHEGRYFSPLHEGLALCFVRHVLGAPLNAASRLYRLIGNSTFGGSMFFVAVCSMCFPLGLLLSCSCSISLDSVFLQRRAPPLPIIETQKSPCERCGPS